MYRFRLQYELFRRMCKHEFIKRIPHRGGRALPARAKGTPHRSASIERTSFPFAGKGFSAGWGLRMNICGEKVPRSLPPCQILPSYGIIFAKRRFHFDPSPLGDRNIWNRIPFRFCRRRSIKACALFHATKTGKCLCA